jgi:sugar lactone lactonase YvrE
MFPDKESIKNIFSKPRGITIGPDNHFYIANGYFNKVSIFDSDWEEIGSIGKPIEKQKKALGELGSPVDISFDKQGNIFVSDSEKDHQSIEVYTKDQTPYQSISSVNGSPSGLAFNSAGNLIVVKDTVGLEVYDTTQLAEKKITKIKTYRNDGFGLLDLAVDENDNMIVSIFYSSEIQWISPKGRMLQKIAGQFGNLDTLSYPRGLFQDGAGNIYVCEPVAGRIQKFSPEGDMIWKSELNWSGLSYITMDSQGKLYVTDVDHNVALVITDKTAIPPGKNDLPPKLTIKPIPNEVFDPNLLIEGETDPGATVAIDRKEIEVEEDGSFSTTLKLIKGNNTINIVATNKAKKQTSQTITVTLKDIPDTTPPSLKLKIIPSVVYESPLLIEGETEPNAIVTVNAKEVSVKQDGSFSTEIDLVKGSNTIKVRATDKAGNQSNLEISITYIERIVIKLIVGSTIIIVKGVPGILDSVPFIDKLSGRTMVPLRAIAEAIGATVSYNAKEQRIDILKDSVLIQLWIGKPKALVNGKEVSIDIQKPISPMIVKGRTFLPLRFIAETFEFQVDWDPKTQGITLTYPKR